MIHPTKMKIMKKLMAIFVVAALLTGCQQASKKTEDFQNLVNEDFQNSVKDVYSDPQTHFYFIIEQDSCEYVVDVVHWGNKTRFCSVTHRGRCKFCEERDKAKNNVRNEKLINDILTGYE